ncbi:MAG: hypothetical protein M0Z46_14370 [Actinomycetota bacterium]|jgi:hypothetical protein|nr:hypothetical protein [Actinomycetota bacterium]
MRTRRRPILWLLWPLPRLLAALVLVAFAAWEGLQGRYTAASHASILAAVAVVLALALVAGRGRQHERSRTWVRDAIRGLRGELPGGRASPPTVVGTLVWVLLIAATIGWDLTSFVEQKHTLPTFSRLAGSVTDHHWGRALLFAVWLLVGLYLALGWRLPARGEPDRRSTPPEGGAQ